jgi:hypothetical protein
MGFESNNQSNLKQDFKNTRKYTDFNYLKGFYNRRNKGCGKGHYGKIYMPKNTSTEIIYPSYKEKTVVCNPPKKIIKNGKELYVTKYTVPVFDTFDIEENVTVENNILNYLCNNWSCGYCRRILKNKLFNDCLTAVNQFNIKYHLILTSLGSDFRSKHYWYESYPIMSKEWHKLLRRINFAIWKLNNKKFWPYQNYLLDDKYEVELTDSLSYLRFIRSQNNPIKNNPIGFSHNHIGINLPLNKKFIDEIIEKNNMKLGFSYVAENQRFLEYLTGDFFTDEEYVIPFKNKHYTCSRDIIARVISANQKYDGSIPFGKKASFEFMDLYMWKNHNQMLPFEEYVKRFYEVN